MSPPWDRSAPLLRWRRRRLATCRSLRPNRRLHVLLREPTTPEYFRFITPVRHGPAGIPARPTRRAEKRTTVGDVSWRDSPGFRSATGIPFHPARSGDATARRRVPGPRTSSTRPRVQTRSAGSENALRLDDLARRAVTCCRAEPPSRSSIDAARETSRAAPRRTSNARLASPSARALSREPSSGFTGVVLLVGRRVEVDRRARTAQLEARVAHHVHAPCRRASRAFARRRHTRAERSPPVKRR